MRSLLALAIFISTLPAFAQTPAAAPADKAARIERLLELTNSQASVDQMAAQIFKMLPSMVPPNAPPDQKAKLEEAQKQARVLITKQMSWARMKPQFAKLYDETFTIEELNGMVAFYESAAGRSMLTKMPTLMQKSMAIGQSAFNEIVPELQRLQKEASAQ
ncbi:MAG: DUF2059 domain-containing protein [Acidobacteriota bacterium]